MIRPRKPPLDDGAIYRLILQELIPLTQTTFSEKELNRKSISRRLDRCITYVLSRGERRPFGFVSFLVKDRKLHIDMIALDKNYQRRGGGSTLLDSAERYGKRKKCRESFLYVDENNVGAQRFYERKGYQISDFVPMIRCFQFTKSL